MELIDIPGSEMCNANEQKLESSGNLNTGNCNGTGKFASVNLFAPRPAYTFYYKASVNDKCCHTGLYLTGSGPVLNVTSIAGLPEDKSGTADQVCTLSCGNFR